MRPPGNRGDAGGPGSASSGALGVAIGGTLGAAGEVVVLIPRSLAITRYPGFGGVGLGLTVPTAPTALRARTSERSAVGIATICRRTVRTAVKRAAVAAVVAAAVAGSGWTKPCRWRRRRRRRRRLSWKVVVPDLWWWLVRLCGWTFKHYPIDSETEQCNLISGNGGHGGDAGFAALGAPGVSVVCRQPK